MVKENHFEVKIDHDVMKIFVSTLFLAQKVGKEAIFEIEADSFTVRALNDAKSAFVAVEFASEFFDVFTLRNNKEPFAGKISSKLVCSAMRSLKNLKSLTISGDTHGVEHMLNFQLTMQSGVTRSHHFHYMDCEILTAIFDDSDSNYIKVRPKVLSQLFEHFFRCPEVLAVATHDSFSISSFHSQANNSIEKLKYMNTGLNVSMRDFEVYDYRTETEKVEMIFCMKEVAAFVGFCDAIDSEECDCFFSTGGRTLKFSSKQDLISTQLVLATIRYEQQPSQDRYAANNNQANQKRIQAQSKASSRIDQSSKDQEEEQEEEEEFADEAGGQEEMETYQEEERGEGENIDEIYSKSYQPYRINLAEGDEGELDVVEKLEAVKGNIGNMFTNSSADDPLVQVKRPKSVTKRHMHARKRLLEESSSDDD